MRANMPPANLAYLDVWDEESGALNVVIETPKGSHNKYKYDPELGVLRLHRVLPLGDSFPFDFGFIPSTEAQDGDPLDALGLLDEGAFAGCVVTARMVGVIEAEQTEAGKTVRNDRLLVVAQASRLHRDVVTVDDLPSALLDQIEHFFISYDEVTGKEFKPIGRHGPKRAEKLLRKATDAFGGRWNGAVKAGGDGHGKSRK
jgi:inorganic pyrophosphatase